MKNRIIIIVMAMLVTTGLFAQEVFFKDSFNDNKNNWPFLGKYNGYSVAIQNGHLRIESTEDIAVLTYIDPHVYKEDYGLSAKMILEKGEAEGLIGMRFGMSNDASKYYTFLYNNEGDYAVHKYDRKTSVLFEGSTEGIVKPMQYNDLLVVKQGDVFSFRLNEKILYTTTIKNTFGGLIAVKTAPKTTIMVDEIKIYDHKAATEATLKSINALFDELVAPIKKGGNE
ncbi:hypothetical protein ACV07N_00295 [Roseivirga echinicomitans]